MDNEEEIQRAQTFKTPLKVLIVEDNQVDRHMLESLLSENSANVSFLKSTDSLKAAVNLLDQYEFDTVVLDLNLPDSEGKDTLIKLSQQYPELAIVVNTGAYEDDLGIKTLSWGAQDFLVKGKYTAYGLNKSLHFANERKRLEAELKQAQQKIKDAQAQLVQAEKLKVVGGLAAGVAHEVKNPLATILYGVTYLIQVLKEPDEKVKFVLDNIKDATNRANAIITDLLDYSGLTKLNMEKGDLN
ncbi:MAG: response regulator, partial [Candidatus Omnitrophica bacterium]|nr:response regulator [Candidatus Omnitrophota bacterium]